MFSAESCVCVCTCEIISDITRERNNKRHLPKTFSDVQCEELTEFKPDLAHDRSANYLCISPINQQMKVLYPVCDISIFLLLGKLFDSTTLYILIYSNQTVESDRRVVK